MSSCVLSPVIYYICSKKCGEIRMTPDASNFQLICEVCSAVFVELQEFIKHIKSKKCEQFNTTASGRKHNERQKVLMQNKELSQQLQVLVKQNIVQQSLKAQEEITIATQSPYPTTSENDFAIVKEELIIEQEPFEASVEHAEKLVETRTKYSTTAADPLAIVLKPTPATSLKKAHEQIKRKTITTTTTKTRPTPTPMLNTKEKLLTFINAISKAPLLWNHSHMDYSNAKLKCQAQDNIAYIMNKEFHTKLCGENIDKQIKSLHDYWIKIKRGECKKTWFSSHLEFFNIYKASSSNDQLVYLIQLYRKFDMLWNREHPQYLNAFEENAAYTKMARLMSERFGNYTKVAVMNSLQTLQTNYFNFMEGKITAFCYYDQMKFLDKFIGQKQLAAQAKTQNNTTINPTKAATVTKETKSLAAATKEVKLIDKTEKVTFLAKIKDIDCDDTSSSSGFKGFPENPSDMAVNNEIIEKVNNATSCNNAVLHDDEIPDDKKRSAIKKRKHKLFISHKVTLALIELYRAKSALWDREDENFYKAQVRSKELAELVSALNSRYNLEVSDIDVRKRITSLRVAYKRFNTTNKYFKQLAFLPRMRDKHRCQYCNQQFMRRQELYAHEYKHTLKKQLPCDQCDKRFTGPAQLRLHQLRHLDKEKYKFLCHECGEHFSQLFQLKHHTYKMHNVPWPQVCNVCQRGFRTRSRLLAHQVQHSAKPPFLCAECGKSFKSIGYLKNHMQSHVKLKNHSKNYVCVICNKHFGTCKNLLVHKQTHASEPKFNCRLCKKRFRQYSSYYYHMQHQHRGKSRF